VNLEQEIKLLKAQKEFVTQTFGNYPIESNKPLLGKSSFRFEAIESLMRGKDFS
jgi:hypothetical protein